MRLEHPFANRRPIELPLSHGSCLFFLLRFKIFDGMGGHFLGQGRNR